MNKIKDFFYNKNDIIVAVIILCIAVAVIYFRVQNILEYSENITETRGMTTLSASDLPIEKGGLLWH